METSGHTREAFRARGHEAFSFDILPSVDSSPFHIQGDVFEELAKGAPWDIAIFHPTCTFVTSAAEWAFKDGPYHQKVRPGTLTGAARREARAAALADMSRLLEFWPHTVNRLAMENPVGAFSRIEKPTQTIQPYEFGENASKRTCLWLRNLPPLISTCYVRPRMVCRICKAVSAYEDAGRSCVDCGAEAERLAARWGNQTDSGQNKLSPSGDRWAARSVTFPGIAAAFADQWGALS